MASGLWPLGIRVMAASLINTSNPSTWEVEAGEILETLRSSRSYKVSWKSAMKLFFCPLPRSKTRLNAVSQAAQLVNGQARRSLWVMHFSVFPFPELCSCLIQEKENHFLKNRYSQHCHRNKKPGAFELLQIVLTSTLSPVLF